MQKHYYDSCIGGEIGGQRGLEPHTHFERRGAEPPHFSNVYTFQYALHNTKKPQNYCQKASETLSES